eukprot:CAMPEP_0115352640 /NCGR_PEP_ID=MMETSP0270-20121206/97614_1 /TAXON_ID=71861 /ORGANISM="Scrippsiella trochoidea, Strain CCMP3099" /LENGTH=143 /DNA_ID=CAMNT_0002774827 /DNA_START=147 /DNA_END=575 /DNA_ORIENTATION=+
MKADDRLGATHDARRDAGLSVADFHRAWSLDFTDGPSSSESSSKRSCHNALTLPTMDLRLHVRTFCSRIGSDSFAAKAACIASRMAKAFLKICANSHGSVTSIAARKKSARIPERPVWPPPGSEHAPRDGPPPPAPGMLPRTE